MRDSALILDLSQGPEPGGAYWPPAPADRYGFEMNEAMRGVDVVLSPTCARAPWKLGVLSLAQPMESFYRNVGGVSDFTALYNVTGQPAMSVPLHTGADGLPNGIRFAARYGDEKTLFRLAAQLERAAPWPDRLSPLARATVG